MNEFKVLTGKEAETAFLGILRSGSLSKGSKTPFFPNYKGYAGYVFFDRSCSNELHDVSHYLCFKNDDGNLLFGNFSTEEGARDWCNCVYEKDQIHQMEQMGLYGHLSNGVILSETDPQGYTGIVTLSEQSFSYYRDECRSVPGTKDGLPGSVSFDANGNYSVLMSFHDGYAVEISPNESEDKGRIVALYYPTIEETEKSFIGSSSFDVYSNRKWKDCTREQKILGLARSFGDASCLHCPKYRLDDAVRAVVQRTIDPTSKCFSEEQRNTILLAANCDGLSDSFSEIQKTDFFKSLHAAAGHRMPGVNAAWVEDTFQELVSLSRGEQRTEAHRGLRF